MLSKKAESDTHVQMMSAVSTAFVTASSSELSSVIVTVGNSVAMLFASVLARALRLRTTILTWVMDGKSSRINPAARENQQPKVRRPSEEDEASVRA